MNETTSSQDYARKYGPWGWGQVERVYPRTFGGSFKTTLSQDCERQSEPRSQAEDFVSGNQGVSADDGSGSLGLASKLEERKHLNELRRLLFTTSDERCKRPSVGRVESSAAPCLNHGDDDNDNKNENGKDDCKLLTINEYDINNDERDDQEWTRSYWKKQKLRSTKTVTHLDNNKATQKISLNTNNNNKANSTKIGTMIEDINNDNDVSA